MANSKHSISVAEKAIVQPLIQRKSAYEDTYGQFTDTVMQTYPDSASLMRDLNRICTITSGLGALLRVVAGNVVLADCYDPADESAEPPLGEHTISSLTTMAAAVCEMMADHISASAEVYNEEQRDAERYIKQDAMDMAKAGAK